MVNKITLSEEQACHKLLPPRLFWGIMEEMWRMKKRMKHRAISGLIGLDGWMDGSPGGVSIERQYVRECRGRMAPYRSI